MLIKTFPFHLVSHEHLKNLFWRIFPRDSICTVGKEQTSAPENWVAGLGSFKQNVNPFYQDNLLLQTKGINYKKPSEERGVNLLWHIEYFTYTFFFLCADDPSGLPFIKIMFLLFSSYSVWFDPALTSPQSDSEITKYCLNLKKEKHWKYFRWFYSLRCQTLVTGLQD